MIDILWYEIKAGLILYLHGISSIEKWLVSHDFNKVISYDYDTWVEGFTSSENVD